MEPETIGRLIDAAAAAIREESARLTELDQAIGDGDHGINMKRGFDAVAAVRDEIGPLPLPNALQKIGMTLVMKVGGAAGPLYGSFFMAMGKALPEAPDGSAGEIARALRAGVDAVRQRGKSEAGEKTMLEVLVPLSMALEAGADGMPIGALLARLRAVAADGLESTRDMLATKGRASYLGERSIGHLDPGACSSRILVDCVCGVIAAVADGGEDPA